jgi:NAD(P)-dependent dehydrogenase (short-subunit alcohol dehydrogenase family)
MKLKDKVAIVVGGGSGIGRASATLMAQEGARVMIADLSIERANKVADNIKAMGGEATTIKIDMRKEEDAKEMVKATLEKYGKVDILVNVAGGSVGEFIIDRAQVGKFAVSTRDKWDRLIDVNLNGCRHCTRAVINHMIERRTGKIINFSSITFEKGNAGVDYTAAKGGIVGLTRALAYEVDQYKIQVNCITPVGTLSERLQAGLERRRQAGEEVDTSRICTPEEVAEAVLFLASAGSDHMSGQNIIFGTPTSF